MDSLAMSVKEGVVGISHHSFLFPMLGMSDNLVVKGYYRVGVGTIGPMVSVVRWNLKEAGGKVAAR